MTEQEQEEIQRGVKFQNLIINFLSADNENNEILIKGKVETGYTIFGLPLNITSNKEVRERLDKLITIAAVKTGEANKERWIRVDSDKYDSVLNKLNITKS